MSAVISIVKLGKHEIRITITDISLIITIKDIKITFRLEEEGHLRIMYKNRDIVGYELLRVFYLRKIK